jgi:hypothetical protein
VRKKHGYQNLVEGGRISNINDLGARVTVTLIDLLKSLPWARRRAREPYATPTKSMTPIPGTLG